MFNLFNLRDLRLKCAHEYIPHFTGQKIQKSTNGPIGQEVDYYYCKHCSAKDPMRKDYTEADRQRMKQFYKN